MTEYEKMTKEGHAALDAIERRILAQQRAMSAPSEESTLEGVLTAITEVKTVMKRLPVMTVADVIRRDMWIAVPITQTTVTIESKDAYESIQFEGVILPDSLGKRVTVYNKNEKSEIEIFDESNNRWYRLDITGRGILG